MAETINGSPTFSNAHTVPTAGQLVTAAAHKAYAQSLANNDKWIYDLLNAGVNRVRTVVNLAALQSLTGMVDGDVALCVPLGIFRFYAANASAPDNVMIVAPNVGTGRWRHVALDLKGVANGLCPLNGSQVVPVSYLPTNVPNGVAILDGSAKVLDSQLPERMVAEYIATVVPTPDSVTEASGWVTFGEIVPTAFQSGDKAIIKLNPEILTTGTILANAKAQFRVSGSTFSTATIAEFNVSLGGSWPYGRPVPVWAVVNVTGNPDHFRIEWRMIDSVTGALNTSLTMMVVEHWRP
jgi:hypothetical protein